MDVISLPKVIQQLAELSGNQKINGDTIFGDIGLDSLDLVEWITSLEDETGIVMDIMKLDFAKLASLSVSEAVAKLLGGEQEPS